LASSFETPTYATPAHCVSHATYSAPVSTVHWSAPTTSYFAVDTGVYFTAPSSWVSPVVVPISFVSNLPTSSVVAISSHSGYVAVYWT